MPFKGCLILNSSSIFVNSSLFSAKSIDIGDVPRFYEPVLTPSLDLSHSDKGNDNFSGVWPPN